MNANLGSRTDLPQLLAHDIVAHPKSGAGRRELSPELAYGRHDGPVRPDARAAAVAVLLCWGEHGWSLPLTVRSADLTHHGGQISFPGGLIEAGESAPAAALREVEEELGICPDIEWLGELAPLFVFASNAVMTPCVGVVQGELTWQPAAAEVEAVLQLPVDELLAQFLAEPMLIERGPLRFHAPRFDVDGRSVWGATAVVLGELRERLRRIGAEYGTALSAPGSARGFPDVASSPERGTPGQSPGLKVVTFDLDGLMFNTEDLYEEVGSTILARRGFTFVPELRDEMMGRQALVSLQVMIDWFKLDATPELLAAETAEIFRDLLPRKLAPMPGAAELLAALEAAGIPRAIATSSPRAFVETVLGIVGWQDRFAFTLSAEDVEHGKPAPDVYLLAAERHGVAPAEMMVLEDSQNGCRAAVAAGAFTVAVPHGRSHTHQFPGARLVADTLADPRIDAALGLQRPQ